MTLDHRGFIARLKGEAYIPPAEPPPPVLEKTGLASKLEIASEKSLNKIIEILDVPLDQAEEQFGSILRAQSAAANTALTTQVRVDETALRRRQLDRLPMIIAECNRIAAGLPPKPGSVIEGEVEAQEP